MEAVRAYYDGSVFVPVEPVNAIKNQNAIITILDFDESVSASASDVTEPQKHGILLGFLKGIVPELPESFFDPLLEEDLQAWEGKNSWGV